MEETLSLTEDAEMSAEPHLLTLQVTQDQESAMEAFFQINSWQLVKEAKGVLNEEGMQSLTVRVSLEQEAALEAFFQLNNWTLIKEIDSASNEVTYEEDGSILHMQEHNEATEAEQEYMKQEEVGDGPMVEEVHGLQEIKVTATDVNGEPQVITVFAEGGNVKGLPESLLELGVTGTEEGRGPQVIIQEITLPEGMSLDQGLVIANPGLQVVKRVTPRGCVKPGDKIHKCHICNKTFKQAQSFNGHYQSHFGAKPFKCDICNTGFTLKAALIAHQSIHTGAKPFVCYMCNKGFRRKDDMISHIRTHTGEKPYECDICGKKFKYRNQIPKHRRGHTGEKPYHCSECEKRFTSNIHLTRHMRTHTGERPYKCTVCPKAFTQFGHLTAHLRIHNDERPYPCEICGRRFREKKVMKRHELLHSAERKFKCEDCGRGFLRQSNLDLHSVMHQKGPKQGGLRRGRPKPKKRAADEDMREFVASVLSNVRKVDSSMQTDTIPVRRIEPASSLVHGVNVNATPETSVGSDNLSAFVNFAVEQQNNESTSGTRVADISELQNLANSDQQITLVMHDDGSGSYLISNYDGSAVPEEIVNQLPSQQVEIISSANITSGNEIVEEEIQDSKNVETVDNFDAEEMALKTLEQAVYGTNVEGNEVNKQENDDTLTTVVLSEQDVVESVAEHAS